VFAARFDFPNKFQAIIDGNVVDSPDDEQIPGPDMNHPLALGYLPAGGGKGNNLRMLLSDYRIYDDNLSNAELNEVGRALAAEFNLQWTDLIIPEPSTLCLMAIGFAWCVSRRYRTVR
jgi:hypothetical protein